METCILKWPNFLDMAIYQNASLRISKLGLEWTSMSASDLRWILLFGKRASRASRHGRVPGGQGVPAGISNVRLCRSNIWARHSIFTAGGWISFSRTMKMKSRSHPVPREKNSLAIGFTTASYRSTRRRCPSRSETSLRFGKFLRRISHDGMKKKLSGRYFDTFFFQLITEGRWIFPIKG